MANEAKGQMGTVRQISRQEVDSFDGITIENGKVQEKQNRQSVFYSTYSRHNHSYSSLKDYFQRTSLTDWLIKGAAILGIVSISFVFLSFILPALFTIAGGAILGWIIWNLFHK